MLAKRTHHTNFEEVRRRSMQVWKALVTTCFSGFDADAMNCIEMVRHVLEGENIYHHIVLHRAILAILKVL